MTFLICSPHSAEVRTFRAMLSMVISVITLNITILGTEFTLTALGGIWMLPLILFKQILKKTFTDFEKSKMHIRLKNLSRNAGQLAVRLESTLWIFCLEEKVRKISMMGWSEGVYLYSLKVIGE